ncbi:MAG: AMP-binding protein [Oscillospiraceae bacterium]|nr:AMP-binding protein [Oscillospiraceae bacterium]
MKLIHERIAKHAATNPSKTALADSQGEISYGELEAKTASLARQLAAAGVRAGDPVAVYVPYAKEIALGTISVWRAGGVFLPFDDAYPTERLDYMLADSGAAAILTLRELWAGKPLRFPADKVILMDAPFAADEAFFSPASLSGDSPAMLLYTSGTTGRPKGVLHTHALLANILDWMNPQEGPAVTENSRGGVVTGFTFIATQVFLWGPLLTGGTVCVAPEAARGDLGYLDQFIREERILGLVRRRRGHRHRRGTHPGDGLLPGDPSLFYDGRGDQSRRRQRQGCRAHLDAEGKPLQERRGGCLRFSGIAGGFGGSGPVFRNVLSADKLGGGGACLLRGTAGF